MKRFNKHQIELLEQLASNLPNLVVVTDILGTFEVEVYVGVEFRAPDNISDFSSITGYKKITHLVDDNSSYVATNHSVKVIEDKIEDIKTVHKTRNFPSNHFGVYKF